MRAILALLLFAVSVAAIAGKTPKIPPDGVVWSKVGTVQGSFGSYTPVVQLGGSQIRIYSNSNGTVDGDLWLRVGSWSSVGGPSMVLHITTPRDQYIRTSAVVQGASGAYYAMLYTGDGYPTQGGYSPSWATSPDGYNWTWHGPIGIFGRNQSSAAALVVDESRTDAYACMAWIDLAGGLRLMHAPLPCNPAQWSSDNLNMYPLANTSPQFVTAAKTDYGYHLIGAIGFPATALQHIFSCDGITNWRVLETNSDVINTRVGKGTNLVYDAPNQLLHALTSGVHWRITTKAYPC